MPCKLHRRSSLSAISCEHKEGILDEMKLNEKGFAAFFQIAFHGIPETEIQIRDALPLGANAPPRRDYPLKR